MPTATPAFTSFVRRSSLALSLSLVIAGFLWPPGSLGKPYECPLQTASGAEGRAGSRFRPASACGAVGLGGDRQDSSPDRPRPALAASRRTTGIDPLPDLHQGCRS